jgi:hypothetical protein
MISHIIWNGTAAESNALLVCLERNCTCEFDSAGARVKTCPPHDALAHSQRFLDGLLFGRRIVHRLIAEEWSQPTPRQAITR